jgi:hypothetical protein
MKFKLIFLVVFAVFASAVNAQTFGIKGGMNIASMSFSASGMSISPKSIIGVHFGPVVDFQIQENLHFNTGLLYSLKGMKMKMEVSGMSLEGTEKFNVLEIPLNVAYKFPINEKSNFLIQAGPYVGYSLSGKDKTNGETSDIDFKNDGVKRFDYGLGFGPGVEFGPVVASLNYQLGLANLYDSSDAKIKNKVLQISVAYMFGE